MKYGDEDTFDTVPEGLYPAMLTNTTLDETGEVSVLTCCYAVADGKQEGRALWQRFRFNDKSMKFLRWQLGMLHVWKELKGAPNDQEAARKAAELMFAKVDQLKVDLKVSHREYNGKTYEDVIIDQVLNDPIDIPNEVPTFAKAVPTVNKEEEIPF